MKKLKAWMAEHKKFSVIALCLLLPSKSFPRP